MNNESRLFFYRFTIHLVVAGGKECKSWKKQKKTNKKNTWEILSPQGMEGCNRPWVGLCQPSCTLWAMIFLSLLYDLSFIPFNFFKGIIWCIKNMKWNVKCCLLKNKSPSMDWDINEKNTYVAGMRTRIRHNIRIAFARGACAVKDAQCDTGGITLKGRTSHRKQSRTRIIGFGIFHYEKNLGYEVLDFPQPLY